MGLLNYIELKKIENVKLTSRPLSEQEDNNLERAQGVCYEEGPSHAVRPMVNTRDEDVELNQLVVPDIGSVAEKEAESEGGKRGQSESKVSGSSSKRRKLDIVESPVVVISSDSESLDEAKPVIHTPLGNIVEEAPVSKGKRRKTKRKASLHDRISQYRLEAALHAAKKAKLVKKVMKLKKLNKTALEKEKNAMRMVAINTVEHKTVVEALQKELMDAQAASEEKLKLAHDQEDELKREMAEKLKKQEVELKREMAEKLKNQEVELKQEMAGKLKQALGSPF